MLRPTGISEYDGDERYRILACEDVVTGIEGHVEVEPQSSLYHMWCHVGFEGDLFG